jgi:transcription elongation GreA/GreB family factor
MFVLLRDIDTGECQAHELVPPAQADANHGRVSIDSPLGRAFADARIGAWRHVDTAHGMRRLQLTSVDHRHAW